jgi:hypothetical protein
MRADPRSARTLGMERANVVQRIMQRVASARPVAFIFRHTFHHIDRALYRLLGRRTLHGFVAGVPNIMLTTTRPGVRAAAASCACRSPRSDGGSATMSVVTPIENDDP